MKVFSKAGLAFELIPSKNPQIRTVDGLIHKL